MSVNRHITYKGIGAFSPGLRKKYNDCMQHFSFYNFMSTRFNNRRPREKKLLHVHNYVTITLWYNYNELPAL